MENLLFKTVDLRTFKYRRAGIVFFLMMWFQKRYKMISFPKTKAG